MAEYEVRPLKDTIEEKRIKEFFQNPVKPEPFPGPISAWKEENQLIRKNDNVLFMTLKRFVNIISRQRNTFLIEIIKYGTGINYIFTNFRISYIPKSNHWGSAVFVGHDTCIRAHTYEFEKFAKYSHRKKYDPKFDPSREVADYMSMKFRFELDQRLM